MTSDADHMAGSPARATLRHAVDRLEERLLGDGPRMSPQEVAQAAGMTLAEARRVWTSFGLATARPQDRAYTQLDLDALLQVKDLIDTLQLPLDDALEIIRAMGRNTDRLATWQTHSLSEALHRQERIMAAPLQSTDYAQSVEPEVEMVHPAVVSRVRDHVGDLIDSLEPLMVYAWRKHMTVALSRITADAATSTQASGTQRAVGFADLVAFTEMTNGISERGLAHLVQRFESLVGEVIADHGGRMVKTVGDEVLFTTREPEEALDIALDLVAVMDSDEILPPLRVGLATGWVLLRMGDVFGTTVNRAHRLVEIATAGSVILDEGMAQAASERDDVQVVRQRASELRGLGLVPSWQMRRDVSLIEGNGASATA